MVNIHFELANFKTLQNNLSDKHSKSKFSLAGARTTNLPLVMTMIASQMKQKQNRVCLIESIIFVLELTKLVNTAHWRRELTS